VMGQQLPVGFYRSASVDGGDMVEGRCQWMNFVVSCGTRGGQKDGAQSKLLTVKIGHQYTNGIVCARRNRLKYLIKTQE